MWTVQIFFCSSPAGLLADSEHFDYVRRLFELVMDTARREHRKKPPRKPPRPSIRLVTLNLREWVRTVEKFDLKIRNTEKLGLFIALLLLYSQIVKTRRIFWFEKRTKTSWHGPSLVQFLLHTSNFKCDTILFLVVEQSSNIELIYIHIKIVTTKQISLVYGCVVGGWYLHANGTTLLEIIYCYFQSRQS